MERNSEISQLVENARKGDRNDMDALCRKIYPYIRAGVYRRIASKEDAEDVIQDIYLSLIQSGFRSFRGKASFQSYLFSVISRRCSDFHRKDYRRKCWHIPLEDDHLENLAADEDPIQDTIEACDIIDKAPEQYRECLYEHFVMGYSSAKIGEMHGLAYEAVRSNYRRGIKWLGEHTEEWI